MEYDILFLILRGRIYCYFKYMFCFVFSSLMTTNLVWFLFGVRVLVVLAKSQIELVLIILQSDIASRPMTCV